MKTWQIIAIVAVICAIGIGVMLWSKKDESKVDNYNDLSDQMKPESENNNSNQQNNSNMNTETTDGFDIKDKFVTLSVQGFGDIKVELYEEDAPKTVENFLRLTQKGYYDNLTFHRIAKDFVIQGGDPTGTGSGGESAFGSTFEDELNPNTASYKAGYQKGVLAMANRGPNTNTSQFFIMLDNVSLPNNYTIFGKVIAGLDVVDKIGAVPITPQMGPTDGTPQQKIVITKATISDQ